MRLRISWSDDVSKDKNLEKMRTERKAVVKIKKKLLKILEHIIRKAYLEI